MRRVADAGRAAPWPNSTILRDDVGDAVTELKRTLSGDLTVMGSGELIHTLMRNDLIDKYLLYIHPLVLGTGRRQFGDGSPPASLTLIESATTKTGVVIAPMQDCNRFTLTRWKERVDP